MLKEIGSNFWFAPKETIGEPNLETPSKFGCSGSDYVWMSTGRGATKLVLQTILSRQPEIGKVALIPAFTCHTVIEPFLDLGFKVHTLPMTNGLITTAAEIMDSIKKTQAKVLLVHRYYGFNTLPGFNEVINQIQASGVVVIEDCTQCLYSTFEKSQADYYVGSIRKWCGVPDGGFAVCRDGIFSVKPENEDKSLETAKREECELKYAYMFNDKDCKPLSKQKYREAEHILDTQSGYYKISTLSTIIQTNLDVAKMSEARRRNYAILAENLQKVNGLSCVFTELTDEIVPLYLPVFVNDRERVQSILAENDVYAPIVWPKADGCPAVCESAEELYNHLLCIPIDQRYQEDDMLRIIKILKDNL